MVAIDSVVNGKMTKGFNPVNPAQKEKPTEQEVSPKQDEPKSRKNKKNE